MVTPNAEMTRPPHQQRAATTPALRGPARSSQPPHSADGRAEEDEEQGEHPAEHGDLPVAGGGERARRRSPCPSGSATRLRDADGLGQRQPEHREAVGHADAQVDGEGGRRHQPAVEAGSGDDAAPCRERPADMGTFAADIPRSFVIRFGPAVSGVAPWPARHVGPAIDAFLSFCYASATVTRAPRR